jgi:hypothetical protein
MLPCEIDCINESVQTHPADEPANGKENGSAGWPSEFLPCCMTRQGRLESPNIDATRYDGNPFRGNAVLLDEHGAKCLREHDEACCVPVYSRFNPSLYAGCGKPVSFHASFFCPGSVKMGDERCVECSQRWKSEEGKVGGYEIEPAVLEPGVAGSAEGSEPDRQRRTS